MMVGALVGLRCFQARPVALKNHLSRWTPRRLARVALLPSREKRSRSRRAGRKKAREWRNRRRWSRLIRERPGTLAVTMGQT